jgi:hypothetical protein
MQTRPYPNLHGPTLATIDWVSAKVSGQQFFFGRDRSPVFVR